MTRSEVQFFVQGYDAGQDPLTYSFDFDNDGIFDESNASGEATHIFVENGNYEIRIRITDDAQDFTEQQYTLSVLNTPPQIIEVQI